MKQLDPLDQIASRGRYVRPYVSYVDEPLSESPLAEFSGSAHGAYPFEVSQ